MSEAETVYERESSYSASRRTSFATQASRNSVSSASSQAHRSQALRSDSASLLEPVKKNSDWVDFHFQITTRKSNEQRISDIREALARGGETLANSTDDHMRSPLHLAAQRGDVQLAHMLLESSADINAKDSQPCSVLEMAVANNKEDFVFFLLDRDVDESAMSKQNSYKFEEMKDSYELRKETLAKAAKKSRKQSKTGVFT